MEKCVLAYSGGLDTSVMIKWIKDMHNCEVICMCADLGQEEEVEGLKEKALQTGASKIYIEDLREEFITDYIYPTMRAGAIYEKKYLLGTSFGRPLIAKRQIEIARREGATMVAHGGTGKGNDQIRFELTYMALAPYLKIVAPWKDERWTLTSREDCIAYAKENNIPIVQSEKRIYSEDRNIWHISHEGDDLENPANPPRDAIYTITALLEEAPDEPEYVEIEFIKGVPGAVNGRKLPPIELLTELNRLGSRHAIGQVDMVENRMFGIKSRGVYETPGGTILYNAHRELEYLVLDRDTFHYKEIFALKYAELVYDGKWFTPLRKAMDAFVDSTQENVTGKVRLKLYKGNVIPAGSEAERSLYFEDLASFKVTDLFDQKDAAGFIRVFGLPLRVQGMVDKIKSDKQNNK